MSRGILSVSRFVVALTRSPDYSFLEDVNRTADSAKRQIKDFGTLAARQMGRPGRNQQNDAPQKPKVPKHRYMLLQAVSTTPVLWLRNFMAYTQARTRDIRLVLMPRGMSRHEENSSRYVTRADKMEWTIHWTFVDADPIVRLCYCFTKIEFFCAWICSTRCSQFAAPP